jgi:hypothetical protein
MSGPQILERAHLNRFDKIDRLGMSPTLVHFTVSFPASARLAGAAAQRSA